MNFDEIRSFCLSHTDAYEDTPFGPDVLVYKINSKMFALLTFENDLLRINLKNTPEKNIELRETYDYIIPGYHMNKKHWNTVLISYATDIKLLKTLITESYLAVDKK